MVGESAYTQLNTLPHIVTKIQPVILYLNVSTKMNWLDQQTTIQAQALLSAH